MIKEGLKRVKKTSKSLHRVGGPKLGHFWPKWVTFPISGPLWDIPGSLWRVRAMDCVPNRDKMTPIGTYFF